MDLASSPLSPHTRLHGPLLLAARAVWVAVTLLSLVVVIASIPAGLPVLQTPCANGGCGLLQLSSGEVKALAVAGVSVQAYAWMYIAISGLYAAVALGTGAVLFGLRSDDKIALLSSLMLVALASAIPLASLLAQQQPLFLWVVNGLQIFGGLLFLFFLFLFPDARGVGTWTRPLSIAWAVWTLLFLVLPVQTIDPQTWPAAVRLLVTFLSWGNLEAVAGLYRVLRSAGVLATVLGWFGIGLYTQFYRYNFVATPTQRQQTKWVLFGLAAVFAGMVLSALLPVIVPALRAPGLPRALFGLLGVVIFTVIPQVLLVISIAFSVLHYRLWDVDALLQRTVSYGLLTAALAVFTFAEIILLQYVFRSLTGVQSDLFLIVSTLGMTLLLFPLQRRVQAFIDRRFYREKINVQRALAGFAREIRTLIDVRELLGTLVERVSELLHITHAGLFLLGESGHLQLAEARNLPDEARQLEPAPADVHKLREGAPVSRRDRLFPLLVPLMAPHPGGGGDDLVGVLALGPRLSGQGYSREDAALLTSLADQAGTAFYVARLIQDRETEARRRETAEASLEAHRNSPAGRAEALAYTLIAAPETGLIQLHALAQRAGQDPATAILLEPLPRALEQAGAPELGGLAAGYHFLVSSPNAPELLPLGLRQLTDALGQPGASGLPGAAQAHALYALCQQMLEADTAPHISACLPDLRRQTAEPFAAVLPELAFALGDLTLAAEALNAYERVDTAQDRLAYLAAAIERLNHLSRAAGSLGSADRPVVTRIGEAWLTVVTRAMSELQTRAQLSCRLLTRHTWQDDVVTLVLEVRNLGRGAAVSVCTGLASADEYVVLEEPPALERLAPGEEAQVQARLRLSLPAGVSQFRARFVLHYADPRGPDQVEHFADVVSLMEGAGEFQPIPNPYVVGTPLQPGSPLFFGRQAVVDFIHENLAAAHRNNLVLIGQRRTGKTSLLKQLSLRLGDDYLPVYLDGQTLGLDPGLPAFFLTLATEIAFAVQDRGYDFETPDPAEFAESPAAAFERGFLAQARAVIGQRHLLILFDEFEELETAVKRGSLDPSIFGFLRHLIQHSDNLSVIFCGTHRLEELATDYWHVLFNISLYRHVGFLEQEEALQLAQQPVAAYGMRYDDLALDKIWRVTSGHPYFLQLLCHSLVNRHNRTGRSYATIADVNAALEEILASGEAHFIYLWTEAAPAERLCLVALSRMMPITGQATPAAIVDYLAERGVTLERRAAAEALNRLALRDVLQRIEPADDPALGQAYAWKLGLLGLWVEKYRSLSRVVDSA